MGKALRQDEVIAPELGTEELDELRCQLIDELRRLEVLYAADVRAGQALSLDGTEDEIEMASVGLDRELFFLLSDGEREQLRLIEEALERMKLGAYGFCQYSGAPIPIERLRAVPWARYCASCQELADEGLLGVIR